MAQQPRSQSASTPGGRCGHGVGNAFHAAGVMDVVPHEPFHAKQPAASVDAPDLGDSSLVIAGQFVGCPTGGQMEVESHAGQKRLSLAECRRVARPDHPGDHEFVLRLSPEQDDGQPPNERDVSQSPRRSLHIRLEQRDRLAVAIGFFSARLNQPSCLPPAAASNHPSQPSGQLVHRHRRPNDGPGVEQGGQDRGVVSGQSDRLGRRPHALPHLESGIE